MKLEQLVQHASKKLDAILARNLKFTLELFLAPTIKSVTDVQNKKHSVLAFQKNTVNSAPTKKKSMETAKNSLQDVLLIVSLFSLNIEIVHVN